MNAKKPMSTKELLEAENNRRKEANRSIQKRNDTSAPALKAWEAMDILLGPETVDWSRRCIRIPVETLGARIMDFLVAMKGSCGQDAAQHLQCQGSTGAGYVITERSVIEIYDKILRGSFRKALENGLVEDLRAIQQSLGDATIREKCYPTTHATLWGVIGYFQDLNRKMTLDSSQDGGARIVWTTPAPAHAPEEANSRINHEPERVAKPAPVKAQIADRIQVEHGEDFHWVRAHSADGAELWHYVFERPQQQKIIGALIKEWERAGSASKAPVSTAQIQKRIEASTQKVQISSVFRGHPALHMILVKTGGSAWAFNSRPDPSAKPRSRRSRK